MPREFLLSVLVGQIKEGNLREKSPFVLGSSPIGGANNLHLQHSQSKATFSSQSVSILNVERPNSNLFFENKSKTNFSKKPRGVGLDVLRKPNAACKAHECKVNSSRLCCKAAIAVPKETKLKKTLTLACPVHFLILLLL